MIIFGGGQRLKRADCMQKYGNGVYVCFLILTRI